MNLRFTALDLFPSLSERWGSLCFYMTWYDIYLLQMGLHPLAVVGKLVQKQERYSHIRLYKAIYSYKRRNNTQKQYKSTVYTKQKNIQHKNTPPKKKTVIRRQ